MKVFKEYNLTMVEKETLKEYLNEKLKNSKFIILGAQDISERLQFSRPRAYAILKNLVNKEILEKFQRKGFVLTSKGEKLIDELSHREKVLETFFRNSLKFPLDSAVEEAATLSIYVSSNLVKGLQKEIEKT